MSPDPSLSEPRDGIEDIIEPFLIQRGGDIFDLHRRAQLRGDDVA